MSLKLRCASAYIFGVVELGLNLSLWIHAFFHALWNISCWWMMLCFQNFCVYFSCLVGEVKDESCAKDRWFHLIGKGPGLVYISVRLT